MREPSFTMNPPGEGTGLGLAVVHGIMGNHDGSVTVHSQPGEGTVLLLMTSYSAPLTSTVLSAHPPR